MDLLAPPLACYDARMKRRIRPKNPHAVALGRLGARKGASKAGVARWAAVPPDERREILRRAALARWRPKRAS